MHGNKGYSYIDSNKIHITKNFIFENFFFFSDDGIIQCTLIDHSTNIEVGIDQVFVSNSLINRIPPRILMCRIFTELRIKEEDWRRLIERKEFDWKIQIVSNHSGGVALVNLFMLGPENTGEKREVNFHDLMKFINDPESVSVGLLTLKRLNKDKIYSVYLEEQEDSEEFVNVHVVEKLDGEMDLDVLYSKSPYSPPGPVSPGSLIIAPLDGNLLRAKETGPFTFKIFCLFKNAIYCLIF